MSRSHGCHDRVRTLGAYLDGECDAAQTIEMDEHVAECETCREELQLLRAMRRSMQRVAKTAAPTGLHDRIGNAMLAELGRGGPPEDVEGLGPMPPLVQMSSWRNMVPLATAAALALFWGAATRGTTTATAETRAGFGDDLLADLVAEHSQPLPPEAITPQQVRSLERYVGVPVHPGNFERDGVRLVGGRVVPLHSQRAAMLQYMVGSGDDARRVSVFVYDAQKIEVGANFSPRAVGSAEVAVGREKGYSVAAARRGGVGYLVASDLDQDKSARLAALAYEDR